MYSTIALLNSHVFDTEPVANRIQLLNLNGGGIAVGQFWGGFTSGCIRDADQSAPNVEDKEWTDSPPPTLTPLQTGLTQANGYLADYDFLVWFTRTGWVKLFANGQMSIVRVTQHSGRSDYSAQIPTEMDPDYFLEILEIGTELPLTYDFVDQTGGIIRNGVVSTIIDGQLFGETDSSGFNVPGNGFAVDATYSIGSAEGDSYIMQLTLTIRKNTSSGPLIYSETQGRTGANTIISISKTLDNTDLSLTSTVWVQVRLEAGLILPQ